MNVFVQPVASLAKEETRRLRWAFLALFVVGAGLRCFACFATLGITFPDEHQQFLEQAHRMVYGYGQTFWEQERGMRHPLYPALLAAPLAAMEAVGVRDPIIQGALLRWLVAVMCLGTWALFAWEFHRRGQKSMSLLLMFLFSLEPDIIYIHVHPLSEIAATIPFLLALVSMERRPFVAGVMLALSFGIRFQMGFIIAGAGVLVWIRNRCRFNRPFQMLTAGFILAMFGLGLTDWFVFKEWFHSPIEYARANLVEGKADQFGVYPWHQYLIWLGNDGWGVVAPLAVLVLFGVRRQWPIAVLAASFIVPHMMIGHKEARFMLPIAPLTLVLVAAGYEDICNRFARSYRSVFFVLALAGMALVAVVRLPQIPWQGETYRATAYLLRDAGRRADLTGIVVFHQNHAESPNFFFLRRNVPLLAVPEATFEALESEIGDDEWVVNYLICRTREASQFSQLEPVVIESREGFSLYRLTSVGKK
jgi:GPI mannosyltransferase 3